MRPMTKQRLKQYRSLGCEIEMLEKRIKVAPSVFNTVQGSSPEIPYAKHTIVVKGYTTQSASIAEARRSWCVKERKEIEQFIAGVDGSTMRQILTWRYIEGLSVAATAEAVNYSTSSVSNLLKDFFESLA